MQGNQGECTNFSSLVATKCSGDFLKKLWASPAMIWNSCHNLFKVWCTVSIKLTPNRKFMVCMIFKIIIVKINKFIIYNKNVCEIRWDECIKLFYKCIVNFSHLFIVKTIVVV